MTLAVLSRCECFDLHQQIVPYAEAYAWQKSIVKRRIGLLASGEDHSDTLIALQHPPVYTLGSDSNRETSILTGKMLLLRSIRLTVVGK